MLWLWTVSELWTVVRGLRLRVALDGALTLDDERFYVGERDKVKRKG